MSRFLFFARDPAGANVIIPVIELLKNSSKNSISVYAKDYAINRLINEGIRCINIRECLGEITRYNIIHFLEQVKPDIIITGTSLDDYTERYIWQAANVLGIKSYAILDQWILPGIRFSEYGYKGIEEYKKNKNHVYLPHKILIMDDIVERMLLDDGIDASMLSIVGQPHFDVIKEKYDRAVKISFPKDYYNVLYASEPKTDDGEVEYLGYSERSIFEDYYNALRKISTNYNVKINIIIRPHPRENRDYWNKIVLKKNKKNINLFVDECHDSFELMKSVDLVCGMSSMFLVEAAICKVPFISCLIGLKQESPFVFDRINVYNSCRSKEELEIRLQRIIIDEKHDSIEMNFITNAAQNVVKCIEEEMKNG